MTYNLIRKPFEGKKYKIIERSEVNPIGEYWTEELSEDGSTVIFNAPNESGTMLEELRMDFERSFTNLSTAVGDRLRYHEAGTGIAIMDISDFYYDRLYPTEEISLLAESHNNSIKITPSKNSNAIDLSLDDNQAQALKSLVDGGWAKSVKTEHSDGLLEVYDLGLGESGHYNVEATDKLKNAIKPYKFSKVTWLWDLHPSTVLDSSKGGESNSSYAKFKVPLTKFEDTVDESMFELFTLLWFNVKYNVRLVYANNVRDFSRSSVLNNLVPFVIGPSNNNKYTLKELNALGNTELNLWMNKENNKNELNYIIGLNLEIPLVEYPKVGMNVNTGYVHSAKFQGLLSKERGTVRLSTGFDGITLPKEVQVTVNEVRSHPSVWGIKLSRGVLK